MRNLLTILLLIPFLGVVSGYAQKPLKKPVRVVETKKVQQPKPIKQSPQPKPIKQSPQPRTVSGHDYVDLGLSVKWATCNVGARTPEQYGDYFAWGETKTKKIFAKGNSNTYNKRLDNIAGSSAYDVARATWGKGWRLPTKDEFEELKEKCKMTWTTYKGVNGYLVERNGKSIFLPAAGNRYGTLCNSAGEYGNYWSSTPNEAHDAYGLYFNRSRFFSGCCWKRYYGLSVRPVLD